MSINENDNFVASCDRNAESSSMRTPVGGLSDQVGALMTNPQEVKAAMAAMTRSSALDSISQANQVLPYIDMTQAFMENPDPTYQKRQTFKPEPQPQPTEGGDPGTGTDPRRRRTTPTPRTRTT